MIKKSLFVLAAGSMLALSCASTPALADSIGYIDMQRVFANFKDARNAEKEFAKKQEAYQKKLDASQKKVEEARTKAAEATSPKDKEKQTKAAEDAVKKMQEEMTPLQEELIQLRNQLTGNLQKQIVASATKMARAYGVDVVVDRQAVLVGGLDITEFVITELNNPGSATPKPKK